jgi:hypothetical protein
MNCRKISIFLIRSLFVLLIVTPFHRCFVIAKRIKMMQLRMHTSATSAVAIAFVFISTITSLSTMHFQVAPFHSSVIEQDTFDFGSSLIHALVNFVDAATNSNDSYAMKQFRSSLSFPASNWSNTEDPCGPPGMLQT